MRRRTIERIDIGEREPMQLVVPEESKAHEVAHDVDVTRGEVGDVEVGSGCGGALIGAPAPALIPLGLVDCPKRIGMRCGGRVRDLIILFVGFVAAVERGRLGGSGHGGWGDGVAPCGALPT